MQTLWVVDLGIMPYGEALTLQHRLVAAKKAGANVSDVLLLLEHPPVITLGRNADEANIVTPTETLMQMGFEVFRVERGGDVTYHGPGQLVGYPILNLRHLPMPKDVGWFVWALQETLIRTLAGFGMRAERIEKVIGVWIRDNAPPPLGDDFDNATRAAVANVYREFADRKIAAIGARIEEWISYHGFALNVNTNLRHFDLIVPCGLQDRGVTSMERELGNSVPIDDVKDAVAVALGAVLERTPVWRAKEMLLQRLDEAPAPPQLSASTPI